MTRCSIELGDWIFMKGYGYLFFAKNISLLLIKNLSGNYSQRSFDHGNESARDVIKTLSKEVIQETVEATGDLIDEKKCK